MNGNKNRPMKTINRNFEEGGEIVIKIDYEESLRTEEMKIEEFHRRLRAYCEKQGNPDDGAIDCTRVCKMAKYCYTAPQGMTDELVREAVSLLQNDEPFPG